ncbi:DUF4258 domain-containing protein [Flavobacterium sp.]|uniref:DUF4258 domain-containing protein n=1 Tax=Flavobacterium sp. TaxID=239 RepID=UPI00286C3AD6|nr:DUF4258 domain-containing protein [Flavobacterium sp.]
MRLRHRFAYYLIGFTFGLFFVTAVFIGKDTRCNYFPNARVLNDLRNKPFEYSDKAIAILNQKWMDSTDIKNTLTYGDVDFDRSNIEVGKGKRYIIEGKTTKDQPITLEVINYTDKAVLTNITKP